jgi:hypothetical protein
MKEKHCTVLLHLPEYYNENESGEKKKVEEDLYDETIMDLINLKITDGAFKHGQRSKVWEKHLKGFYGTWIDRNSGQIFIDENRIIEFTIGFTDEAIESIKQYMKDTMCGRFEQVAMFGLVIPDTIPL